MAMKAGGIVDVQPVMHASKLLRHTHCLNVVQYQGRSSIANCHVKGEQVGTAVLTEKNVQEIRRLAAAKQTYVLIAKRFGIHKDTVYKIVKHKLWAHVKKEIISEVQDW
jgi:DNA invertase Pin-like site-specific DNA recombinase